MYRYILHVRSRYTVLYLLNSYVRHACEKNDPIEIILHRRAATLDVYLMKDRFVRHENVK